MSPPQPRRRTSADENATSAERNEATFRFFSEAAEQPAAAHTTTMALISGPPSEIDDELLMREKGLMTSLANIQNMAAEI